MAEDTDAAVEALRQAMANEQRTRDFYLESAEKVSDDKGRRMFRELAEEEVVHMKVVQRQYESLKAGMGWTDTGELEAEDGVDISPLEFKRANMEAQIREGTSDLQALTIAAEMENNSFVFYTEQYARATDPLAKSLYGQLVKAERNHFNTVMSNWESLVHSGFWVG
jgi:rubrerythrin